MSGHVEQRLAAIDAGKFPRVNELVAEPRESSRIEGIDDPIDDMAHARDARHVGMIGQPDVEHRARIEIDRDEPLGNGRRIGRQPADPGSAGDRERMGAAGIGAYANHAGLRAVAQDGCIEFPRGGLLGNLEHEAMPG